MSGDAARAFMTLMSVCPPARARAPSFAASSSSASATEPGFAYSTSRNSMRAILSRCVNPALRVAQPAAVAARPRRDDLREDRHGGLSRRVGADVETGRPGDARELVVGHAVLAEDTAPPLLVAVRADPADVERVACERAADHRQVELVVVREHHDRGADVRLDLRERLVRPEEKQFVGAGNPLARRKARPRVGDDGTPAEESRRAAERLGRVGRSVHEEPRRRRRDICEDSASFELDHVADAAPPRRLEQLWVVELVADALAGDDRKRYVAADRLRELLDEDVDHAAAWETDLEGHVVGDAVCEEPRRSSREHFLRREDDVVFDTAARDRAE